MALLQFIQSKGRVLVDPKSLILAALNDIWNYDESPDKDLANKMLTYMALVAQIDPSLPFYGSDHEEVRYLAKSQVFRAMDYQFTEEEEIMIENAIDVYIKENEMADERMLQTINRKIDEMRKEIDTQTMEVVRNVNNVSGAVTFATNFAIITKAMREIDPILDVRDNLIVRLETAKSKGNRRVKADRRPSFLETQMEKLVKAQQVATTVQSQSDEPEQEQPSPGASPTRRPRKPILQADGQPQPSGEETKGIQAFKTTQRTPIRKQSPPASPIVDDDAF
jgi:hypothetical protein